MPDPWGVGSKSGGGKGGGKTATDPWGAGGGGSGSGGGGGGGPSKKRNLLQNIGHAAKSPLRAGGRALASGPVSKTLDVLDRPGQAVKGAIVGAAGELGLRVLSGPGGAGLPLDPNAKQKLGIKGDVGDAGRLAWRGLTGKEKFTTQQAVEAGSGGLVKLPTEGAAGAVIGFVGDVALDPTTYVTFGAGTAAKAGLRKVAAEVGPEAAEAISKVGLRKAAQDGLVRLDEVTEGLARATAAQEGAHLAKGGVDGVVARELAALERRGAGGLAVGGHTVVRGRSAAGRAASAPLRAVAASAPAKAVRTGLVPRARLATVAGQDAADRVGEAFSKSRAFEEGATADVVAEIRRVIKATGATEDELRGVVRKALDEPGAAAVPARLQPLVDKLDEVRSATTEAQLSAQVFPEAHLHDESQYLLRTFTGLGRKALDEPGALRPFTRLSDSQRALRQGGSTFARELAPDAPLGEAERLLTEISGELPRTKLRGKPQTYYEHNAAKLVGARAARANRAVAQSRLVDDLARITDDTGEALVHTKPKAGLEAVKIGEREVFAHPQVAEELARSAKLFSDDKAIRASLRAYDEVLNAWKGLATVPLTGLGFHARNAQGNFWNNFLAGVKDPRDYVRAARLQKAARAGGEGLGDADREVLRLADEHGIFNRGAQEADLAKRDALNSLRGKGAGGAVERRASPLSPDNVAVASGRAVGSAVENNARLAHFIHVLAKTGDAERAAMSVKRYLFDYADLTALERQGLKRVIPFYTFMRKNTPLQFSEAVHQPGKFTALGHATAEPNERYDLDLPPVAAVEAVTGPLQPGGAANQLFSGGLAGAAKTQIVGESIPLRGTEKYITIPVGRGSESRLETLASDLVPLFGKYGKAASAKKQLDEGDLLRLLLGLRRRPPKEDEE